MSLPPILAALRKHKSGVVLIALQIALTLAIVCNAVFIIADRIDRVNRPTGLVENNLMLVTQQFVDAPSANDPEGVRQLDNLIVQDVATLKQIPGVSHVAPVNSLPLLQSAWNGAVSTKPNGVSLRDRTHTMTTYYFMGPEGLDTLGLKLAAGRNFSASEVTRMTMRSSIGAPGALITRALADKLFPDGSALGKPVYLNGGTTPTVVLGIVRRMQTPGVGSWADSFAWNSVILPQRLDAYFSRYAIRVQPGRMDAVRAAVGPALYKSNPMRVLDDDSIRTFAEIRADTYKGDVGMAILMGVICLILIAITGAGIVGLTSFWVGQRRRQIGVRRALGARKVDILRYFQLENLIISGAGAVLGMLLAVGLNLWLMQHMSMARLPVFIVALGVLLVLALGQAAVFGPARRAAEVPPVMATRSV